MDPKEWLQYEERCIEERPPACVAACPIHLDTRSFVSYMQAGNFNKAYDLYRRTVPFPGILSRICDHPCEAACKRKEVGDPIAIGKLEHAAARLNTAVAMKTPLPPAKHQRVAVVGAGLSGLTAAVDLARKGYRVVVFEATDKIGGRIWETSRDILPRTVVNEDLQILELLRIEVQLHTPVGEVMPLDKIRSEFDAVYLGLGKPTSRDLGLTLDETGGPLVNEKTFATNLEGVFAGGNWIHGRGSSPVMAVSDGRRAALSIDRFLQGVSLTAVRDNEGPYETSLYTRTDDIEPLAVVSPSSPDEGYTQDEAMKEAARCIDCHCLECVKNCEFLSHYKAYPKKYARQINQNLRIVMGIHGANTMINSCSLCGLCKEICPTDFDMSLLVREARKEMVAGGRMPPSAHDFPISDMMYSNSEEAAFTRNQPGHSTSAYAFFPGCSLSGSNPDYVEKVYTYLTERLDDGVGMMSRCCGAPAEWAGETALFEAGLEQISSQWEEMGRPKFIMACSSCYQMFKTHLPEIPLVSLWELYDTLGLPENTPRVPSVVAVHDACTTRYESQIHDSVRNLLTKLGVEVEELQNNRERTECCGYGGLMLYANRELSNQTLKRRIDQSTSDYLAYCSTCKDMFVAGGKRTFHILDLIYGAPEDEQLHQKVPGYSRRRQNRASVKHRLLERFWGETIPMERGPHEEIRLQISSDVEELMINRLIPYEDLQKVVYYAETQGEKILDRNNGHILACHTPVKVTYWVEYRPNEDGTYSVFNAYSHRMVVERNHPSEGM